MTVSLLAAWEAWDNHCIHNATRGEKRRRPVRDDPTYAYRFVDELERFCGERGWHAVWFREALASGRRAGLSREESLRDALLTFEREAS